MKKPGQTSDAEVPGSIFGRICICGHCKRVNRIFCRSSVNQVLSITFLTEVVESNRQVGQVDIDFEAKKLSLSGQRLAFRRFLINLLEFSKAKGLVIYLKSGF